MNEEIENLKAGLKAAIDAYLIEFEKKYDGEFEKEADINLLEPRWFGDYVFSIDEIILDIENPEQSGEIFKWFGACVDNDSVYINFRGWLMGARFK
jgi:hypothetical protein